MLLVQGTIVFDAPSLPDATATAHVRLEDTSRADAPSVVVSRTVLPDLRLGEFREIRFSLEGAALQPGRRYGVRVLVDLDGDGQIGRGDFVNVQSCPIAADRIPTSVAVTVRRVS